MVHIKIKKMLIWQGLAKTSIGSYFSDQIWVIKTKYLGWSTLKSNYFQTLIDFELNFFPHGSIHCIKQLSCLQIWILFIQEYVITFWMKTITKSTRFCWSLYKSLGPATALWDHEMVSSISSHCKLSNVVAH